MKKGGFMKDAIILFAITLIAGICLGGVYEITKEPIAKSKMAANLATYQEVYADAADFKADDALTDAVEKSAEVLAAAGLSIGNVEITDALSALDASGNVIGHIITGLSKDGYGGNITVSVGVTSEGEITGIGFIEINETPGLGMNATNDDFKNQFKGKKTESLNLVKGGGAGDDGIDALSGATITSSAVTNAVNGALYFAHNCIPQ